jgi:hypothetical protein
MSEARDIVVFMLGQILLAMEINKKMTVGQAADRLLLELNNAGFEIRKKALR